MSLHGYVQVVRKATKNSPEVPQGAVLESVLNINEASGEVVANNSKSQAYTVYLSMANSSWKLLGESYVNELVSTVANDVNDYFQATSAGRRRINLGGGYFINNVPEIGDALKPKAFRMTTINKNALSNGRLLIYIQTTGKDQSSTPSDFFFSLPDMLMEQRPGASEPLEKPFSAALYVNSKIVFQDILAPQVP